ncbi:MAG: amino acid adenylation domain-containing protein [Clostridia bacterium]|nr:amino acid adenylation domain-containing protein [Clostridia bacterium]
MKTILEYLDLQAMLRPEKAAFCDETVCYSFSESKEMTMRIGSVLLSAGANRESVAILLPRSATMLLAMLGTMRAGCPYVPLDAELGALRLSSIFERVQPRFLIADESTEPIARENGFSGTVIRISEAMQTEPDLCALADVYHRLLDVDPAYIVFTSGSTGAPKGVIGKHSAMLDYAEQLTGVLRVTDKDVFGMQAPLYVDACLKEILSVLRCGATLWIVPKRLFMAPVELVRFLNDHAVTTVCWVVPALTLISSLHTFSEIVPTTLKTIAFGSEVFPIRQLHLWEQYVPARYINLYGPTECTGMSCWYEIDRAFCDGDRIPIGRPFDNTEILLLDESDHPATEGEICIRGVCLCHGYWNDPEHTAAAFVQNPLCASYPDRIYRTGDHGRYNARGELEFLGRIDNQIKRMGHRIELGELENAALKTDGVSGACAVFDPEKNRLALAYTGTAEKAAVVTGLRGSVPEYMLPGKVLRLDRMPLTGNGKTDRLAVHRLCFPSKPSAVK